MSDLPDATPSQIAALKLQVPGIANLINEFQMSTLAANMTFELAPSVTVGAHLSQLVVDGLVTEENLVDIVRVIRISLLGPSMAAEIDRVIQEQGYAVKPVFGGDDSPSFAYSVGLTGTVGFELVSMAGMDHELNAYMVNAYSELAKAGELIENERSDLVELSSVPGQGLRTKCVQVDAAVAMAEHVCDVRGEVKRIYQVLIADKHNLFPGEEGYEEAFLQPRLPAPQNHTTH
ncbi:hypothetical protein PVE_R2G0549 [Pseudomonas veronii 1YdBTEX2]|uniref:Uncharacterized protein n=1 Tax=Pseudomonas veronii 1YdBTEX2 TaxID=1295141 RepID=A0A1D3K8J4_PSEVE|nr:DUF4262 domain-containing protein [Pseudomonas sp. AP19]OEC64334.1 hypothetical protein A7D21_33585 [Pseudomonas sp. AP19]SBW84575.1 hypothetical protein PVE_R2G0549 [Pseudomonas veronii 1YdBTEX2]